MPGEERYTLRMPLELRDALERQARADGRTLANLMVKILTEWADKHRRK